MGITALEGIRYFGYHGLFAQEQEEGNEFEVDVYLDSSRTNPINDNIDEVLDYAEVYQVVVDCMGERANLLETLVMRIGRRLLDLFPEVRSARVRVSKLDPPLEGECRRSYVEEVFTQR